MTRALALATAAALAACAAAAADYDVVVYGATPAGIMAAAAAADEGATTLLIHPLPHVGGMVAGGLGETDKGNADVIGGSTLAFFQAVGAKYGVKDAQYTFEPHVAEAVFLELLAARPHVTLLVNATVTALALAGGSIQSITVTDTPVAEGRAPPAADGRSSTTYTGRAFLDASYEGDLLPLANVSWTWGREGVATYNESLAGRLFVPNKVGSHQFKMPLNATWSNGTVLPMIYTGDPGQPGEADTKVQAFNFRMCLTANASNRLPFARPDGYDADYWELARRYINAAGLTKFASMVNLGALPRGKFDANNNGPISSDFIGGSWGWPTGTPAARAVSWEEHALYTRSWLWFLSSDPALPAALRADMANYGYCADEFTDHGGFPWQLYVREGRRLVGEYVFTQWDRQVHLNNKDATSIALFSYNIDSHNAQRFVQGDYVRNEGDVEQLGGLGPGQLPYGMIVPARGQTPNLLVPVAASASHVGFGAVRLEPQWMMLGQSAGVAAVQALHDGVAVQDVDLPKLQARLVALGQKLHWPLK